LNILVTGADGFVGRALCSMLTDVGHRVHHAVRTRGADGAADTVAVGDIGGDIHWRPALDGIEAVIHLAGRAHVMQESVDAADAMAAYRRTNVRGTEQLARAAAAAGTRRLVFVSSIKVNGEATFEQPFRESDLPRPDDDYGRSKWEAEQRLTAIAADTGLEVVIVRPPLIYGPGVKGNLARLMRTLERGVPLPLGAIDNRRSLIGLTNLTAALRACAEHPGAAGRTFLVSDGADISTPQLIRALASALECPARLIPVPIGLLQLAARLTRSGSLARLTGSLQIDSSHIRDRLGWRPLCTLEQELTAMVAAYRASARS
jgi:nucleoside-diphosphate-sugar epimerase